MRRLDRLVPGTFDVVLAADNALPHLLSAEDLAQAIRAIARKLRPDGLLVASIRDYDEALRTRPAIGPVRVIRDDGGRRTVHQIWEWLDERRYRVHLHVTRELAEAPRPAAPSIVRCRVPSSTPRSGLLALRRSVG